MRCSLSAKDANGLIHPLSSLIPDRKGDYSLFSYKDTLMREVQLKLSMVTLFFPDNHIPRKRRQILEKSLLQLKQIMSTIDFQTFATIQAIIVAQIDLVKISTPIMLILGNFGEISSIIVFVQRTFRTNSCAISFLAASCLRLLFINYVILSNGLAVGNSMSTFCLRPSFEYCSL